MNFKDLKQWEQLDCEIEFWEKAVKNDGLWGDWPSILCKEYTGMKCYENCPLGVYAGRKICSEVTPYSEWFNNTCEETAQAMVDRLVEIRNRLFRLDR